MSVTRMPPRAFFMASMRDHLHVGVATADKHEILFKRDGMDHYWNILGETEQPKTIMARETV